MKAYVIYNRNQKMYLGQVYCLVKSLGNACLWNSKKEAEKEIKNGGLGEIAVPVEIKRLK